MPPKLLEELEVAIPEDWVNSPGKLKALIPKVEEDIPDTTKDPEYATLEEIGHHLETCEELRAPEILKDPEGPLFGEVVDFDLWANCCQAWLAEVDSITNCP